MVNAATRGCESQPMPDIAACLRKGERASRAPLSVLLNNMHWDSAPMSTCIRMLYTESNHAQPCMHLCRS